MAGVYRRGRVYWGRAQRAGREYRRSLKTADRAVAERRLRDWLADLDAIAWGDKPRRTFDETAARFIREHLTTLRPGGAGRYATSLKVLALHFGGKTLDRIGSAELSEFETARRGQGRKPPTVRRDLACLSSMFASAIDWEWIDDGKNPVPGFLRRRAKRGLKESQPRTRYLSIEEEAALLAAATPANMRTKKGRQAGKWTCAREAITLAIDTGLRREELFSLHWHQIDMARGVIITTTRTKSGRARMVPLPQRARTILGTLPRYIDCDYLFVNPDTGTRFLQMNKGLKGAARRAGIVDLRWHDLRRTTGCRWLQRDGKSIEEVSLLLGHSSVTVTEQRYAFLEAEAVAQSLAGCTKIGTGTADKKTKAERRQKVA